MAGLCPLSTHCPVHTNDILAWTRGSSTEGLLLGLVGGQPGGTGELTPSGASVHQFWMGVHCKSPSFPPSGRTNPCHLPEGPTRAEPRLPTVIIHEPHIGPLPLPVSLPPGQGFLGSLSKSTTCTQILVSGSVSEGTQPKTHLKINIYTSVNAYIIFYKCWQKKIFLIQSPSLHQ